MRTCNYRICKVGYRICESLRLLRQFSQIMHSNGSILILDDAQTTSNEFDVCSPMFYCPYISKGRKSENDTAEPWPFLRVDSKDAGKDRGNMWSQRRCGKERCQRWGQQRWGHTNRTHGWLEKLHWTLMPMAILTTCRKHAHNCGTTSR